MESLCIIGAGGLMGTALREAAYKAGYEITCIDRFGTSNNERERFIECNLLDGFDFELCLQHDVVMYCAGKGVQANDNSDNDSIYQINTFFPIRLVEYLGKNNFEGKFLSFGSYWEIGSNASPESFTEEQVVSSCLPVPNAYCVSKRLLSRYYSSCNASIYFLHLVLPTLYGENEDGNRLIPYLLKGIKNSSPLQLTSGEQVRQYLYIGDFIKIVFLMISSTGLPKGIYNIPSKETLNVKDLVTRVYASMHQTPAAEIFGNATRRDEGMKDVRLDYHKIKQFLNIDFLSSIEDNLPKYQIK